MVIFLNSDGTAQKVTPEHVYQGSNNVTSITVVAPYAAQTSMRIGFILPNGLYWQMKDVNGQPCGNYAPMQYVGGAENGQANAWTFTLPISVTEQYGDVCVAINALEANGNRTSYMCKFTVEESVVPSDPPAPEKNIYDYLQEYLGILDGRTKNVPNLVARIDKVAPNAFTYTNNSGIVSAPIVIEGGDAAPMPVGVASTIKIPIDAWQAVRDDNLAITGYTVTITAAQHAQMRDGANANDLWVSFDKTADSVISGAYQGYTVSVVGDITINVNTPVAMTVRVWNGKGLVDEEARGRIAAEIERAEVAEEQLQSNIDAEAQRATAEEADLQKQIDYIVDVGTDKFARAEIVKETARAEAAEKELDDKIKNNTSDIEGLRRDFTNADHFKGVFTTVEELKGTTATPNDYAYIPGGNIWVWENDEWTDSEKPVPDSLVPASTAIPLMDGEGAVGTSNNYARGDHRHPSDTTKANLSGATFNGDISVPNITAQHNITAAENITAVGNMNTLGTLHADGVISGASDLTIQGNITGIDGTLHAGGFTAAGGNVTANNITATNDLNVQNNVQVGGRISARNFGGALIADNGDITANTITANGDIVQRNGYLLKAGAISSDASGSTVISNNVVVAGEIIADIFGGVTLNNGNVTAPNIIKGGTIDGYDFHSLVNENGESGSFNFHSSADNADLILRLCVDSTNARPQLLLRAYDTDDTVLYELKFPMLSGTLSMATETIVVDNALSDTSTNPVQNKVVKKSIDGKVNKSGDTMTGNLEIQKSTYPALTIIQTDTGNKAVIEHSGSEIDIIARNAVDQNQGYLGIGNGAINAHGELQENGQRVYSPNNKPPSNALLNAYPVGAIYISTNSTSPAILFGGSWYQISNGNFLKAVSTSEQRGMYVDAGLPNITGTFTGFRGAPAGAFSEKSESDSKVGGTATTREVIDFDASRSSSIYGKSTTVTPKHYCVLMWQRTA